MIRTTIWVMKWGTIFSLLFAGVGWMMGNNGVGLAEIFQQFLGSSQRRNSADSRSRTHRTGRSRTDRPKPWDSFEAHREWQYHQEAQHAGVDDQHEVQSLAQQMVAMAMRTLGATSIDFIGAAKKFLDSVAHSAAGDAEQEDSNGGHDAHGGAESRSTRKQSKPKGKAAAGRSRSR